MYQVSLRLARLLSPTHTVKSVISTPAHEPDIKDESTEPVDLSLDDSPVSAFSAAFEGQDVVYFLAGAGNNGDDAAKVFDAIKGVAGPKPRLVMVSTIEIDVGDPGSIPTLHVCRVETRRPRLDINHPGLVERGGGSGRVRKEARGHGSR